MSHILVTLARCAPRGVAVVSVGGTCARTAHVRTLSSLSSAQLARFSHCLPRGVLASRLRSCSERRVVGALTHTCDTVGVPHQRVLSTENNTRSVEGTESEGGDSSSTAAESTLAHVGAEAAAGGGDVETVSSEAGDSAASSSTLLVQVSGIPFDKTLEEVENFFMEHGCSPVKVTMPLRPPQSNRAGQNKGKAFVELSSEEELEKSLGLSREHIGDRWVTVNRLRTPLEETRSVRITTVRGMTEDMLIEILERELGTAPISIRISEREERNYGVAFVEFERPESAQKAVELDGAYVMGRWLDVSLATSPESNNVRQTDEIPRNQPFAEEPKEGIIMLIRGLPFDLTNEEIKGLFLQQGMAEDSILQMRVPKHYRTDSNTGIAYLNVKDEEAFQQALTVKGSYVNNRWVDVGRWFPNVGQSEQNPNGLIDSRTAMVTELQQRHPELPCVMVKGIPFEKSEDDLKGFFETQGISSSMVQELAMPKYRQTTNNMGMAWLVVNDEAAYNRLMELSGTIMDDRWLTITDA